MFKSEIYKGKKVIEHIEKRELGEARSRKIDVRFISSTNNDTRKEIPKRLILSNCAA